MYDAVLQYFLFTGALTGSIIFTIALVALVIFVIHEGIAIASSLRNNTDPNEENDPS